MKEFVENMLPYERDWFFLLNGSNSVFLDQMMYTISGSKIWIPLYAFVLWMIFYKAPKKEALLVAAFFILTFTLCDQFSSGLVKPFFERLRPGHHPDFKDLVDIVNDHRGGGYSFISGHATNCFGFAVFLSFVFRNRRVTLVALAWAALISYSRIYLGMHFISDVAGGILAGTFIAVILYAALIPLRKKLFHTEGAQKTQIYPGKHGNLLALVFAGYFLAVILFSLF
ncbi:MAG: phosphatase PAP2 family protein [Bacteroidales bacterium]|jgi:undecaprenyl-diphosphatase|nr:phosphatase PAP2 family protein [Bacteroidales bacterium]